MAYSKIILNGETLMDVTSDTVDAGNLLDGETATKNSGAKITGSLTIPVTDVEVNGTSVVDDGVAEVTVPTKVSDLTNDSGYITGYTETDPVFAASAAHSITSSDISNWNNKVSDDKTWNGIELDKSVVQMGNNSCRIPFTWDAAGETSAKFIKANKVPTADNVALYDGDAYLKSTTPTSGDNSTKVATTAYVNSAVPTKTSDLTNDSGFITGYTETDPTVPSWAKQTSKPSYTASEVGAVPTSRTVNGKALSSNITLSASDVSALPSSTVIPTITDTYSGTSSDGMSGKAVKSAIDALDGSITGTAGVGKTLTAFSQTNGKVTATFGDISITKSQVSDFPTIPTVNNATLTIQKNGTTVKTFTANASSNVTANITVPTTASEVGALANTVPAASITSANITNWNNKVSLSNFVVESTTISTTSIAANTAAEFDTTVTKSGYYPIGVVGFSCANGSLVARRMYIDTIASGSCHAVANVRNVSSSSVSASSVTINILWIKEN